jgi:hypothetical protein
MDDADIYTQELESKLRTRGLTQERYAHMADHIEKNKAAVKKFLIDIGFTKEDF